MKLIKDPNKMQALSEKMRQKGKTIGFVPTMGALHEGHLSLVRAAVKRTDFVVVSIFVNPLQFGPKEDLKKYPRSLKKDKKLLKVLGVDAVFAPKAASMFKKHFDAFVEPGDLSKKLCGRSRPGHFRGVTTVVARLFNIVKPHIAFFGLKDFQQQLIIRKMVKDLNMRVKIISLPTVREKDGLAMSSRNSYLSKDERQASLVLNRSLKLAKSLVRSGTNSSAKIKKAMKKLVSKEKQVKLDYLSISDPSTLEQIKKFDKETLIALAAFVGKTRLIDNILVKPRNR